jgi:hypothetical protein
MKRVAVKGEFELGEEMKKFCKTKGIKILKDRAGPAGIVSKSLLKKGEEMWKESKMPTRFWGDAVPMANQIRKREGSTDSKSAWEQFDGSKPWKVEHDFGEKVELSVTGEQGLFLGYVGQDGRMFKILRLKDKKMIMCKDVKFAKKPKVESDNDLTDELKMELQKSETDNTIAVGAESGKSNAKDGARDKAVKPAGGVQRSVREHKPPERLSMFVGDRSRKGPLRF